MAALKLFVYRAGNRLFSRRTWVVLYRHLASLPEIPVPDGIELREALDSDVEAIARALPGELAGRLSFEQRVAMVAGRFNAGVPCILAIKSDSGQVVGGCWCSRVSAGSVLWPILPERGKTFEISTLFVDPTCRGKSLGSVIVDNACSTMKARGFNACVSLVWYVRPASIKAHLKVGFKPIGEKVTLSFLGFRGSRVKDFAQSPPRKDLAAL